MSLPPFDPSVFWKEYEIDTPTFQITPVEKPDMSPFLFHMTGYQEIISILKGQEVDVPNQHGFLKSVIPESSTSGGFDAEVVCFTESPVFALDFFRHRSYRRWQENQMFGIGFEKTYLVELGVRPCFYTGENLTKQINSIQHELQKIQNLGCNDKDLESRIIDTMSQIYPLTTPLLETNEGQGFMWEREWRYPKTTGFVFPYDAIRIICCPEEEENEIKQILNVQSRHISYVRTWIEYDEVTDYMRRRQDNLQQPNIPEDADIETQINTLREFLNKYKAVANSLINYSEVVKELNRTSASIDDQVQQIKRKISGLEYEVKQLELQRSNNTTSE